MWLFQIRNSSIVIPRYVIFAVLLMDLLLKFILSGIFWILVRRLNMQKKDLSVFSVKRFALNHLSRSDIITLPMCVSSSMFEHSKYMALSSAKMLILPSIQQFARSLMYRINSSGPSTEPCGTPQVIGKQVDFVFPICTYCDLFER